MLLFTRVRLSTCSQCAECLARALVYDLRINPDDGRRLCPTVEKKKKDPRHKPESMHAAEGTEYAEQRQISLLKAAGQMRIISGKMAPHANSGMLCGLCQLWTKKKDFARS